jgi:hypothetical protein
MPTRRVFLQRAATFAVATQFPAIVRAAPAIDAARAGIEAAHGELWRRLVDRHNVVLDYTELDGSYDRANPAECRLGKPNALAWWTPFENGAMFNGLYLDGIVRRALHTKSESDREKVRRIVEGLLFLASVSPVKGFVARCVATDGKTTYPMGSNDQTVPWFLGLWRYAQSGLPDSAQRQRVIAKFVEVAEVLAGSGWRMPAAPPFNFRGAMGGFGWDSASRFLFVLKALHDLTADPKWDRLYRQSLHERRSTGPTRLELSAGGLGTRLPNPAAWTGSVAALSTRNLWELERDPAVRAVYARGLAASATFAAKNLPLCRRFSNDSDPYFEADWRKLNALWREQKTEDEASALAREQLAWINQHSPRRRDELGLVREPLFSAWIVSLCPDRAVVAPHRDGLLETLAHYRYERLRYSQFFPAESAWWRIHDTLGF